MNAYRTHTQLSSALRALAHVREEMNSRQSSPLEKLTCYVRWVYLNLRVRQLIDKLHRR